MELIQLKYFKTIAATGKLSEAAQTLFVSSPALSTSMSRLEKELGVTLFDRTGNRISLNQQGHIFLKHVNQIFDSLESAKAELRQSLTAQGQHVSVAFLVSTQWVRMLTAFSVEHPNFTLSCTTIPQDQLHQTGLPVQYNFLLAVEDAVPDSFSEDMDNIPLFEDHPMVMLPLHHPLAKKQSIDIRDLRGENIFLPMKIYAMYDQLSELFAACDMQLPEDNAYSHFVSQELVAKGLGVGFTTQTYLNRITPEVRCLPISNAHTPSTTRIYWRKSSPLTPEQCAFRDFVENYFER